MAGRSVIRLALGAEIADDAGSRIEPDADSDRVERRAVGMASLLKDAIDLLQGVQNGERAFAAMDGVVRIIKRRVEERGETTGHDAVDGAAPVVDRPNHRRKGP